MGKRSTVYWLRLTHAVHSAVLMGITPLIGLVCMAYVGITYGATTSVTLGVGDTMVRVQGATAPNSFITILDAGNTVGTTVADSNGSFSHMLYAVSPGIHQYQLYSRDSASRLTDVVSIQMHITEHTTTTLNAFLPPTLTTTQTSTIQGTPRVYEGSTVPDAIVTLTLDDSALFSVTAGADGEWSYRLDTVSLTSASHTIYAQATDNTQATSYRTQKQTFVVTTPQAPPAANEPGTPTSPTTPEPPTITPLPNETVTGSEVVIEGQSSPNTQIILYGNGQVIGSTVSDSSGRWRIVFTPTDIEYNLQAQACTAGVCSDASPLIRFFYQPAHGVPRFSVRPDRFVTLVASGEKVNTTIYITNGKPPFLFDITWGDGRHTTLRSSSRTVAIAHIYNKAGQYASTVTVSDSANQSATLMLSSLVYDTQQQRHFQWLIVFIPFLLLLLAMGVGRYTYWRIQHRHHSRKHAGK